MDRLHRYERPDPLHESRRLGALTIHALQAGGQQLDGGAMFGVVPKPLWERRIPADERNRIPLGMRCLLIEHPSAGPVLIDTGVGNKEDAKFLDIYGIENSVPGYRTMLEAALAAAGYAPADVRVVINSHLHFDHAGGNTALEDGQVVPSFPNARYLVHAGEMQYATHTNERTAASYFPRNWDVLRASGQLELVQHDVELVPGIRMRHTPGHTPWHQSIVIESEGETAVFLADLCPTAAHVPLPWIMGYDVEPLVTLESKRTLWADAAAGMVGGV